MKKTLVSIILVIGMMMSISSVNADEINVEVSSSIDDSLEVSESSKARIGDSYYEWSMDYEEGLNISYRNFSGDYTSFYADNSSYYLTVYIEDSYGETVDSLLEQAVYNASYYKLIRLGTETNNDDEYVRSVYKDGDWIYEERMYLKGDKVYTLTLDGVSIEDYRANDEYAYLLDSFTLSFGDQEVTENLSNLTEDGNRLYKSSELEFSIEIPAEWSVSEGYYYTNVVTFEEDYYSYDYESDSLEVEMYSKDSDESLEGWLENKLNELEKKYNSEYVEVISTEDMILDGLAAKKVLYSLDLITTKAYIWEIHAIDEEYAYTLTYTMSELNYNDSELITIKDSMIDSFKTGEADLYEIGYLMNFSSTYEEETLTKWSNETYHWSIEAPESWLEDYWGYSDGYFIISDLDDTMSFSVETLDGYYYEDGLSLEEYIEMIDEELEYAIDVDAGDSISKEIISEKGLEIYKYDLISDYGYGKYIETYYFFEYDGTVFFASIYLPELNASEENLELLNSIWESLEFYSVQNQQSKYLK